MIMRYILLEMVKVMSAILGISRDFGWLVFTLFSFSYFLFASTSLAQPMRLYLNAVKMLNITEKNNNKIKKK